MRIGAMCILSRAHVGASIPFVGLGAVGTLAVALGKANPAFTLVGAILLLALALLLLASLCSVEKLPVGGEDGAVWTIYHHWVGNPDRATNLPEKLRGAFWMSDNPDQELGASFEGAKVDLSARTVTFWPGGTHGGGYQWTYDSDCAGWLLYATDRVIMQNKYIFKFDAEFSQAQIYFVVFGLIPIPSCICDFTMVENDPDGNSWQRITKVFGFQVSGGTYTLKKVIDGEGQKLPAYSEMVRSIEDGVEIRDQIVKTKIQLVPKPLRICGGRCKTPPAQQLTPKSEHV
jgi:hypothetical protein